MRIKDAVFCSFTVFDKIKKLQDNEGYLIWKHEMTKVFNMIDIWTYIGQPDKFDASLATIAIWA